MRAISGAVAGVLTWLGWLTISPAFGFPTLATAGMLNRAFVPREDPGSWLGWALLVIGLASAALLYPAATRRGLFRPSIASGIAYGALLWLVAGAVVMPLLGLADPLPPGTDPMHGSFMMLHLGVGAALAALIAWLLFGAVLGATASSRSDDPLPRRDPRSRILVLGGAIAIVAVVAIVVVLPRPAAAPAGSSPTPAGSLATGPVAALPPGTLFFSIIELPQAAGGVLGPHAHVPGFAYSGGGVETLTFDDGRTVRVGPGEAGFMGTQAPHTHLNADDRVPAAALALLIIVVVVALSWLKLRREGRNGSLLAVGLAVLIVAGVIGTSNPWSNDWLFLSVRPVAGRGAPMPIPTASRAYESPDLGALPPGPYVETLEVVTVAPGTPADVGSVGATALFVLDGSIDVQPAGGSSTRIGRRGATLVQPGGSVRLSTTGDRPAHLLKFAVMPAAAS